MNNVLFLTVKPIPGSPTRCKPLLVISNDGFEQVAETLVTAGIVLAGDLQQQPLKRIQAPQGMPRNGVGEARPHHDELMLAFTFRSAGSPPNGIVKPA